MAAKKKAGTRPATKKKAAGRSRAAAGKRSTAASKKKKTQAKKKPAAKKAVKKAPAAKKTAARKTASKKTAAKKKPAAKKKTTAKKKTAAKKKAATRKKTAASKKPAGKTAQSSTASKQMTSKKTTKKQAAGKKPAAAAKKKSGKSKAKTAGSIPGAKTGGNRPTRKRQAGAGAVSGPAEYVPYERGAGEEYMNAAQVEHFRDLLTSWRKELMEEVDRTVHHLKDDAGTFPDPNDRATQEEEFALELRTRDRERKLIRKIDESLSALDSGDYGYCEICGVEIGIERLEARPTATLCIDCKTLDEIRERQHV